MKSKATALILLIALGFTGAHKFYLDQPVKGIWYMFTFGFFGIGLLIDLLTIDEQVNKCNQRQDIHYIRNVASKL